MSNPSTPRANKPVHNGRNSKTAAAPNPGRAKISVPRLKVTGTQVPKTEEVHLPQNRARALFAAAARKAR